MQGSLAEEVRHLIRFTRFNLVSTADRSSVDVAMGLQLACRKEPSWLTRRGPGPWTSTREGDGETRMDSVEELLAGLRRELEQMQLWMAVDPDGELKLIWKMLMLKRGCRRTA